jgi:hypothetical protein
MRSDTLSSLYNSQRAEWSVLASSANLDIRVIRARL